MHLDREGYVKPGGQLDVGCPQPAVLLTESFQKGVQVHRVDDGGVADPPYLGDGRLLAANLLGVSGRSDHVITSLSVID